MTVSGSFYRYHLSDSWYPAKSKDIRKVLRDLDDQVAKNYASYFPEHSVTALLVPHAAYMYSGVVAASAYSVVKLNHFKRVIILAPSHFISFTGVALPDAEYDLYKSRVGFMSLDVSILKALRQDQSGLFINQHRAHDVDHAIEMQIPLIQKYCGDCKIVPLIFGHMDQEQLHDVANAIQQFVDDSTLLIATTDLTHYGSVFNYLPFISNITQNITNLDGRVIQALQNIDDRSFSKIIKETGVTICGSMPVSCLLSLLEHRVDIHGYVTGYNKSIGLDQNPAHSVSYVGMVFANVSPQQLPIQNQLTGYERQVLLKIAKDALLQKPLEKTDAMIFNVLSQSLRDHRGVFVTLRDNAGQLRGCMGTVLPDRPLYEQVYEMARSAAFHDSRFIPVTEKEIENLQISISIIDNVHRVVSYHQIRLGIDGVILRKDGHMGLFLPDVASEFGWDVATMLSHLCRKAGLSEDAWKDIATEYELFQTIDIA